jgi:hypothetical protein
VQLELPPFSQFTPSVLLLLGVGAVAAWGWSLGLLAGTPERARFLPVWLWAVLLVIVPGMSVPVFLLIGSPPIPRRTWRAIAMAVAAALVVTIGVVAIQQIGIMDCRVVRHTGVCEMEPRSTWLPIGLGIAAAIFVGTLALVRGHRGWRRLQPLPI